MSNHTNMSAPICQRVLERLEAFEKRGITRVEQETHFDDYDTFVEGVKNLNQSLRRFNHMVDLDDTDCWAMSGDSRTTGYLCVAFEHPDGQITLLREVCAKKDGVPYTSESWLPEYNFTKQSPVSLDEQVRFLQWRYYETSPTNPLVFRYVLEEDEEDEAFLAKHKEHPTCVLCSKKCECQYGHNPYPLYQKDTQGKCCNACNQMVLLARLGMLKVNAEGEFEFLPMKYKPSMIGITKGDD